jgi:hypothetical protein
MYFQRTSGGQNIFIALFLLNLLELAWIELAHFFEAVEASLEKSGIYNWMKEYMTTFIWHSFSWALWTVSPYIS